MALFLDVSGGGAGLSSARRGGIFQADGRILQLRLPRYVRGALRTTPPCLRRRFKFSLRRDDALLEILHEESFAFGNDPMSFGGEFAFQIGNAPGIFRIHFAAGLQGPPIRIRPLRAFCRRFDRGVRGDPREDAGGDWAGDVRSMPSGEGFADFVDRGEPAFRHAAHQLVHFPRRRDDAGAGAPAFALLFVNLENFGKAFAVRQLFLPAFLFAGAHLFFLRG